MKKIVIIGILVSLAFIGCFSPWKGEEASIILSIGGSTVNRSIWPHEKYPYILDEIVYNVTIDGQDYKKFESIGGKTIKTTVTPGIYTITIEAWYLNAHYAKGSLENITIIVGKNTIPFPMTAWVPDMDTTDPDTTDMDPNKTYLIAEGINNMEFNSLSDALFAAQASKNTELENLEMSGLGLEEFTISIGNSEHFLNSDTGIIQQGHTVTIKNHGNGTAYIKSDSDTPLFLVYGNLTLQDNIILEGDDDNYSALINVYGILNMIGNVKIIGNNNKYSYGGGVCVFDGGIFNMYNGIISNNKTFFWGGGVYVEANGTFNMYDGIIGGNKAGWSGGGIYITKGGFFHKERGTIYGNDVDDESLWNIDEYGWYSVYLCNLIYRDSTVWPEESLDYKPEEDDDL